MQSSSTCQGHHDGLMQHLLDEVLREQGKMLLQLVAAQAQHGGLTLYQDEEGMSRQTPTALEKGALSDNKFSRLRF